MHILPFRPEIILYLYMANCITLLVFNVAYIFVDRTRHIRMNKKLPDMIADILHQMERLKSSEHIQAEHIASMRKRLGKAPALQAFEQSIAATRGKIEEPFREEYLTQMRIVFLGLSTVYEKKDVIEQAYFAYVIEHLHIDRHQVSFDGIIEFCLNRIGESDIPCRENALKALYSIGNPEAVLAAWRQMERFGITHSLKLLTDGLLRFSGNQTALAHLLFENRDEFNYLLLLPVMQFIRFRSGDFQQEFYELLNDEHMDKELRLEALRYFRKYPYAPARETIQNFLRYHEAVAWEYSAMAALALSSYPGPDTVVCLKDGLHAFNWYVRMNSADALINGLKIAQIHLHDIYNGKDRFAKEALQYIYDRAEIMQQEAR